MRGSCHDPHQSISLDQAKPRQHIGVLYDTPPVSGVGRMVQETRTGLQVPWIVADRRLQQRQRAFRLPVPLRILRQSAIRRSVKRTVRQQRVRNGTQFPIIERPRFVPRKPDETMRSPGLLARRP